MLSGNKLELEKNYIFWPILIFCAAYIALFMYIGFFQWPQADDWCIAGDVNLKGMSLFQFVDFYTHNVNGRFFAFIMYWLLLQIPLKFYGLYTLITMMLYAAAAYVLADTLCKEFKFKLKILLTLIITAVTLALTEAMNETVYWLSAMHYVWSEAFLIFAFALALRALNGSKKAFILCLIILFIDGITLEQPVVMQGIIAFLAALYFLCTGDRKKAFICGAFWLVSIAGFLIMYFAPGTAHRIATIKVLKMASDVDLPLAQQILHRSQITLQHGIVTASKFFIKPFIYVFILFLPSIAERVNFKFKLKAWHIILCVVITAFLNQAIGAFASGVHLAPRAETFALWSMLALWCLLFGFYYRDTKILSRIKSLKIFKFRYVILILCLIIAPNFASALRDLKSVKPYLADNAERVEIISSHVNKGIKDFAVPFIMHRPKLLFLGDLSSEVERWDNRAYANYFGANDIFPAPRAACESQEAMQRWLSGDAAGLFDIDSITDAGFIYDIAVAYDLQSDQTHLGKDNAKAIELYKRSASLGHNQSNRSLARLYLTNPEYKNYFKGAYWLARYIIGSIVPLAI